MGVPNPSCRCSTPRVAIHTTLPEPDAIRAQMIETTFVPRSEVEQQTPPTPDDDVNLASVVLDTKEPAADAESSVARQPAADAVGLRGLDSEGNCFVHQQAILLLDPRSDRFLFRLLGG